MHFVKVSSLLHKVTEFMITETKALFAFGSVTSQLLQTSEHNAMVQAVQTVVAGVLHDVVDDTVQDLRDIRAHFGDDVARLVGGVSKLSNINQVPYVKLFVMKMSPPIPMAYLSDTLMSKGDTSFQRPRFLSTHVAAKFAICHLKFAFLQLNYSTPSSKMPFHLCQFKMCNVSFQILLSSSLPVKIVRSRFFFSCYCLIPENNVERVGDFGNADCTVCVCCSSCVGTGGSPPIRMPQT